MRIGLLTLCLAIAASALAAPAAFAERTYDSQISGFSSPHAIGVDGSDDVWITDTGTGVISEQDPYPSQTKIGEQTGGGQFGATYLWSIGLNDSTGYLYVADSGPVVVDIFDGTGAFTQQFSHGLGNGYDHVAVDNSSGASNGRFYVSATGPKSVQAFDPANEPVDFSASTAYINGNSITGTPAAASANPGT